MYAIHPYFLQEGVTRSLHSPKENTIEHFRDDQDGSHYLGRTKYDDSGAEHYSAGAGVPIDASQGQSDISRFVVGTSQLDRSSMRSAIRNSRLGRFFWGIEIWHHNGKSVNGKAQEIGRDVIVRGLTRFLNFSRHEIYNDKKTYYSRGVWFGPWNKIVHREGRVPRVLLLQDIRTVIPTAAAIGMIGTGVWNLVKAGTLVASISGSAPPPIARPPVQPPAQPLPQTASPPRQVQPPVQPLPQPPAPQQPPTQPPLAPPPARTYPAAAFTLVKQQVNVRDGGSTQNKIIAVFHPNTAIMVHGNGNCGDWYNVTGQAVKGQRITDINAKLEPVRGCIAPQTFFFDSGQPR